MDNERFEEVQKAVDYINEEVLLDDRELLLFNGIDAAIEALRNNKIPGVTWTAEDEEKYQLSLKLEEIIHEPDTEL